MHCHELLDQKFAGIWHINSADVLGGLADCALELLLSEVSLADEAAGLADVHAVAITNLEQAFLEETSSSMGDHAVTFHFSESESTVSRSSLSWLSCEDLDWATTS